MTNWSGAYPNLCGGKWSLLVNGVNVSEQIPEDLRKEPMNTRNTYVSWYFEHDTYAEAYEEYEDGLDCRKWIEKNKSWLDKIITDDDVQIQIYEVFQTKDWRGNMDGHHRFTDNTCIHTSQTMKFEVNEDEGRFLMETRSGSQYQLKFEEADTILEGEELYLILVEEALHVYYRKDEKEQMEEVGYRIDRDMVRDEDWPFSITIIDRYIKIYQGDTITIKLYYFMDFVRKIRLKN